MISHGSQNKLKITFTLSRITHTKDYNHFVTTGKAFQSLGILGTTHEFLESMDSQNKILYDHMFHMFYPNMTLHQAFALNQTEYQKSHLVIIRNQVSKLLEVNILSNAYFLQALIFSV